VESGGDNLTATFSPALVDAQLFVLDVAGGGDVARKGGPGIGRADLLVINKTDLGPYVGVDVPQMIADGRAARDGRAVIGLSRLDQASVDQLTGWVRAMLAAFRSGTHVAVDPGPMAPHFHADENLWHAHDGAEHRP
jgi:urease accessory protein